MNSELGLSREDRELVIGRAERHFLQVRPHADIHKSAIHGTKVQLFDHYRRVIAEYNFEVTRCRILVWPCHRS